MKIANDLVIYEVVIKQNLRAFLDISGQLILSGISLIIFCVYFQLEKLEDVKAQTKKLQQENESLSFVVESKSRFERCG